MCEEEIDDAMIGRDLPFILNLANSIMGVSLLAMPFCFMRCGILLGTVLLLASTYLTTVTCNLLVKAGILSKRKSYEFLAYDLFGASGKLAVEVGIAGVQLGVCIAFHVIIGDLGPSLISKWSGVENTATLRMFIMIVSALTVSLPLSLMRNLESITKLSVLSICFYVIVVFSVVVASWPNLIKGRWTNEVDFWNTKNIFQCLPIFAMAFGCQTQMFILYDALPEPSLSVLRNITKNGVNLCMIVYLITGFFGYIAYYDKDIGGDVLLSFAPSFGADLLKFGFVISVALSFPLMVFPCRQSLNTLLFSTNESLQRHAGFTGTAPMSTKKFTSLTVCIIIGTLCIGVNFPNVEFVIGLNGSTMGCLISFIFPAVMFLKVVEPKAEGSFQAKVVLLIGILTLCLSTYSTIQNAESATELRGEPHQVELTTLPALLDDKVDDRKTLPVVPDGPKPSKHREKKQEEPEAVKTDDEAAKEQVDEKATRKEPPNPQPPNNNDDGEGKGADAAGAAKEEKDGDGKSTDPTTKTSEKKHKHTKATDKPLEDKESGEQDLAQENLKTENRTGEKDVDRRSLRKKAKEGKYSEETKHELNQLMQKLAKVEEGQNELIEQNKVLLEEFKEIKKEKESLESEVGRAESEKNQPGHDTAKVQPRAEKRHVEQAGLDNRPAEQGEKRVNQPPAPNQPAGQPAQVVNPAGGVNPAVPQTNNMGGQPVGNPGGNMGGQPVGNAGGNVGGQPVGNPGGNVGGQPAGNPGGNMGGQPAGNPGGNVGGQPVGNAAGAPVAAQAGSPARFQPDNQVKHTPAVPIVQRNEREARETADLPKGQPALPDNRQDVQLPHQQLEKGQPLVDRDDFVESQGQKLADISKKQKKETEEVKKSLQQIIEKGDTRSKDRVKREEPVEPQEPDAKGDNVEVKVDIKSEDHDKHENRKEEV